MNAQRRKSLEAIRERIDAVKADLEEIKDEEQQYFDNMPDALQSGAKGEKAEGNVQCLEDAVDYLSQAVESIEGAES